MKSGITNIHFANGNIGSGIPSTCFILAFSTISAIIGSDQTGKLNMKKLMMGMSIFLISSLSLIRLFLMKLTKYMHNREPLLLFAISNKA